MNNTEKVRKYGKCFGKNFRFVDGTLVIPDWQIEEDKYRLLRGLFDQSDRNDRLDQVGWRICYLDLYYGTQLYRRHLQLDLNEGLYHGLARRLSELDNKEGLYQKIKSGDEKAVNIIAEKLTTNHEFSFASKFCFFNNEDDYPIYDSKAMSSLRFYSAEDQKVEIPKHQAWKKDLKKLGSKLDYCVFKRVMYQFKEAFGLDVSYKELDWYLWTFGKAIDKATKIIKEKRKGKIPKDVISSFIHENAEDTILSLQE